MRCNIEIKGPIFTYRKGRSLLLFSRFYQFIARGVERWIAHGKVEASEWSEIVIAGPIARPTLDVRASQAGRVDLQGQTL